MLLIAMLVGWLKDKLFTQPGQALWLMIPGIALLSLLYLRTEARQKLILSWSSLVFLAVYLVIFFIAVESRVLDWKRTLAGYDDAVPSNSLALNRLGDWHYKVLPEKPANQDLAIVLLKRSETLEEGRLQIADLIEYAAGARAKGVALDVYFSNTGEQGKELNEYLCQRINEAGVVDKTTERSGDGNELPVLVGYDFKLGSDRIERVRIDSYLEHCLPQSTQGHAIGYLEWDNRIRSVPLYLGTNRSLKALSLIVAERLAKMSNQPLESPNNGLLQFTKPASDFKIISWDDVWNNYLSGDESRISEDQSEFQDRFILVGEDSDEDRFLTPYGAKPGVVIHAYAVHSLRHNQFIKREGWWASLIMISLVCYLLRVLTALGVRKRKLILINVAFSILVVAIAIIAMRLWLTWIDLVYPLLAVWLFLFLLSLRRTRPKTPKSALSETVPGIA